MSSNLVDVLTLRAIQELADTGTLARGKTYFHDGAVGLLDADDELLARIERLHLRCLLGPPVSFESIELLAEDAKHSGYPNVTRVGVRALLQMSTPRARRHFEELQDQRDFPDQGDHSAGVRPAADPHLRRAAQSRARGQLSGPVVGAPAGAESGWGVNFTHQGDTIFATWFTYDDGTPLWL